MISLSIVAVIVVIVVVWLLFFKPCEHQWKDAKICTVCGTTEGKAVVL